MCDIYLVSLESDRRRREQLSDQFPLSYKKFKIVEAIDGRNLSAKDYYQYITLTSDKPKRILSPAEVGCSLSHMKAIQRFLDSGARRALILEDDVIGNDRDIQKILQITTMLNTDSLLLCGAQQGIRSKKYQFGRATQSDGLFEVSKFSYKYIFRTCCYVVTRVSAQKILSYQLKNFTLADKWDEFFHDTNVKIYYADILLHPEDLSNSHIEPDRKRKTNESVLISRNLIKRFFIKIYKELMTKTLLIKGYKRL